MGRGLGSISSPEAKTVAQEMTDIIGTNYSYNFDVLRLMELLIVHRLAEGFCDYSDETPIEDRKVTVEIPLLGELTVKPREFHYKHRLTDEPSVHFDFDFKPISCFKTDLIKAYGKRSPLTDSLNNLYTERLKELYERLKRGD